MFSGDLVACARCNFVFSKLRGDGIITFWMDIFGGYVTKVKQLVKQLYYIIDSIERKIV